MLYPETPAENSFNTDHDGNRCHVKPCGARFALWPAATVADPDRHCALLFYSVISAHPGEFHSIGSSVAIWGNFADRPTRPAVDPPVVPNLLAPAPYVTCVKYSKLGCEVWRVIAQEKNHFVNVN